MTIAKIDQIVERLRSIHGDGYGNIVTGLGMPGHSKANSVRFNANRVMQREELESLYRDDGLAARIINRVVDDSTRSDWTPVGADRKFDLTSVKSRLDDLDAVRWAGKAWKWGRLYGGGLLVIAADDGRPYSEPLDLANVKSIKGLSTLDSVTSLPAEWGYAAATPSSYRSLTPWSGLESASTLIKNFDTIHASRLVRFDGCEVPPSMLIASGGWAPSVLQRCQRELAAYGAALAATQEVLNELSVMVITMPEYEAAVAGTDDAESAAVEMLRLLRLGIDNHNILLLDSRWTYQEVKRSIEGFDKLLDRYERALVAACGLPRLILTGEQASGLGASSGDEVRSWYDSVEVERKDNIGRALNRILEIEFACRRNRGESVPSEWTIRFAPLTTPDPKAKAEVDGLVITATQALITMGAINIDQARQRLISAGVIEDLPTDNEGDLLDPNASEPPVKVQVDPDVDLETTPIAAPVAAPVAELALNGAQVQAIAAVLAQVSTGELAVESAMWMIGVSVPAAVSTAAKKAEAQAAVEAAAALAPPRVPVAAAVAPVDALGESEEEQGPTPSTDPVPTDAKTPQEIAAELKVNTIRVTRLVREGKVRLWNKLGKQVISLAEVHGVIASDNPDPTDQP